MSKITVTPSEIRGWGNVLKSKSNTDFTKYKCTINQSTSSHDGFNHNTFYMTGFLGTILTTDASFEDWYAADDLLGVSVVLKNNRGTVIRNATVKCTVNDNTVSAVTNSNGVARFNNLGPFTHGEIFLYFHYDGSDTLGATALTRSFYCGVNIELESSQAYYFDDEIVSLFAIIRKYGLNTNFEGLCIFELENYDVDDVSYTFTNIIVANGRASLNHNFPVQGHYRWKVRVGSDVSTDGSLYIVNFPYEFNNLLLWMHDSYGASVPSQYPSEVDLRDDFNNLLSAVAHGSESEFNQYYHNNFERINNILIGIHALYTERDD